MFVGLLPHIRMVCCAAFQGQVPNSSSSSMNWKHELGSTGSLGSCEKQIITQDGPIHPFADSQYTEMGHRIITQNSLWNKPSRSSGKSQKTGVRSFNTSYTGLCFTSRRMVRTHVHTGVGQANVHALAPERGH